MPHSSKKSFPTQAKEREFFERLCIESNMTDLQPAKNVYFAMLRVIMKGLNRGENVYLPQWGEFVLRIRKAGRIVHKDTGEILNYGDTKYVYFKPYYKLRRYFRDK